MLENTERAIKNERRETDNMTKKNKTKTQRNVLDTTIRKQTQITYIRQPKSLNMIENSAKVTYS